MATSSAGSSSSASAAGGSSGPFGGPTESWRRHPMLRITHPKDVVPGFGTALGLFALYCVGEWIWKSMGAPKLAPSGKSVFLPSSAAHHRPTAPHSDGTLASTNTHH